jgi:hypothetical protein
MGALALLGRLVGLITDLVDWLKVRRIEDKARAEMAARQLKEMMDAVEMARRARDLQRRRDAGKPDAPDGLLTSDGFRRD